MDRRRFIKLSSLFGGSLTLSTQLTGCGSTPDEKTFYPAVTFSHGVASGDPTTSAVILWTRAVPQGNDDSAYVRWQIATSADFSSPLRDEIAKTSRSNDFTVKVDVQDLPAGTQFYYRFFTSKNSSVTGTTRTIARGIIDKLKFAVFSCANYPAGYFNAYAAAAQDKEIDVVLHLGDYIYEYAKGGYATENADSIGRPFMPGNEGELLTLKDYRLRYATYRQDKGLLSLHQRKPFIAVWDDHEIANDTYMSGAKNHTPDEGDFFARRTAAIQAYYEWLPIRPPMGNENPRIYRSFEFGNLVNLYMLDTRVIGRQKQLDMADFKQADGQVDTAAFASAINDPNRTLLGKAQFNWLASEVKQSRARWQVLGQQILMGKMHYPAEILTSKRTEIAPKIAELTALVKKQQAGARLTRQEQARLATKIPYNLDAWDGYAAERQKVLKLFSDARKSLVVIAGDTHNGWVNNLTDETGQTVAVEYATPSVSSPGMEAYVGLKGNQAKQLADALPLLIDDLAYCNLHERGYMTMHFTLGMITTEWHYMSNVSSEAYTVYTRHTERFVD
ncbi:alkaline phosphatase D family protein [Alteromonas lipolytica]|uniref:Alkaline phosphatase n=1 Tax=Alteromonas lipolytica TaxID=1856405 RepID=A0A1E8FCM4_9ALTE|nr:alkaline phosphatase D family protein [Alteromonas lipolytica]OFI33687.1 alkaline phosphatase [Alteromonas lipolytica]GGF69325.1 alkaline phosphatase [Alteromonas lipolytica]